MEYSLWFSRPSSLDLQGGLGFVVDSLMVSFHPPSVLFLEDTLRSRDPNFRSAWKCDGASVVVVLL